MLSGSFFNFIIATVCIQWFQYVVGLLRDQVPLRCGLKIFAVDILQVKEDTHAHMMVLGSLIAHILETSPFPAEPVSITQILT